MISRITTLAVAGLVAAFFIWEDASWPLGPVSPSPAPVEVSLRAPATHDLPRITGPVRVVDGDTIHLGDSRIRLHGIDAPESDQACLDPQGEPWACGDDATERLVALIGDEEVHCTQRDIDRYRRIIGECFAGETNLNAALVEEGLAFAYRRYSMDYALLEDDAREARRGFWSGEVQAPWDHRRNPRHALTRQVEATGSTARAQPGGAGFDPPGDCLIKGNINSRGERIYHTPASPAYGRTRIDESRGQRWFCSEEEARAAGWRPPRG
jgi:endonuclease YncB( thermonuclease family)